MDIHYWAVPAIFGAGWYIGYMYADKLYKAVNVKLFAIRAELHKIEAEGVAEAKAVIERIRLYL